ncbi:heme lyase CcmF/NrfE family subunit [Arenibaculum pallidiluteum]|uniref:heme lyase CcmF/NrfE family subunit n=1 Tax=Arenibaculum pallidiluteum TaxID=2812559 RepID=UPI001A978684|nr:heme lyase CcmF/NrfE family subunit [Arenibaculum pallidiluteum]
MIPELGHYALVLALFLALVQSSLPLAGAARGVPAWMEVGKPAALGQFALVALAFAALMHAYVVSDFSVLNVVQNSHTSKPMLYKVTGVWGNHEGSMLLWVLILSLFGAAVALFGRNLPPTLKARVLSVQGLIGVGFLLFILLTSNPFVRIDPPPLDGQDLNPLLQDPGLAFHPPFLYLGYVGFSVAFSFAAAALIEGRVDPAWARWVRPWTLAAWCGLTVGIALGSWWAYYELGWGGWWFWDPVENASFMPWLAGTALLHSAIVVEKRDALKSWTILLAILTFGLSLVGTFLVRSGVLSSVHAFAVDPARGVFILALLMIAMGGSLLLYGLRAPVLKLGGLFAPISREGALVLNNLLLSTATATVFLGTMYPLFLDAVGGGKVSVGPPFFNATFVPLMVPLVAAMAVGPLLAWKRADLAGALGRLKAAAALTAICVLATLYAYQGGPVLALVGIAMAAWAFFGALAELADRVKLFRAPLAESLRRAVNLPRSAWGTAVAHAGLGIAIAGMTGSTAWMTEKITLMRPGETVQVAGYDIAFTGLGQERAENYVATLGSFRVTAGNSLVADLRPSERFFPVTRQSTTEAAIHTNWVSDLYVVLGKPDEQGAHVVRIYHHPLVPWIWIGAIVMAAGGCISLSDRRFRVGVPERRARPAAPVPAE